MLKVISVFTLLLTVLWGETGFAKSEWAYCYDGKSNRIYFQTKEEIQKHSGRCLARTYYQGRKNFNLVQDSIDEKGFPRGEMGAPINMDLKDGRNILITHWNDLSKSNRLVVLEADLKLNRTNVLCEFENHSNAIVGRFNKKAQRFQVKIREPLNDYSNDFRIVWKNCGS